MRYAKLKSKVNYYKKLRWCYLYLGYGYIHFFMLITHRKKKDHINRKPSNFLLWVLTVYLGFYSIAIQRYELSASRLTSSFSALVETLSDTPTEMEIQGLIDIQKREIPSQPIIFNPCTVVASFLITKPNEYIISDVQNIVRQSLTDILPTSKTHKYENLILDEFEIKNVNVDFFLDQSVLDVLRLIQAKFNLNNIHTEMKELHLKKSILDYNFNNANEVKINQHLSKIDLDESYFASQSMTLEVGILNMYHSFIFTTGNLKIQELNLLSDHKSSNTIFIGGIDKKMKSKFHYDKIKNTNKGANSRVKLVLYNISLDRDISEEISLENLTVHFYNCDFKNNKIRNTIEKNELIEIFENNKGQIEASANGYSINPATYPDTF
ncbi:MAG: hypothetical protein WBA74_01945 [Cyclobacteriaceae bacterium]